MAIGYIMAGQKRKDLLTFTARERLIHRQKQVAKVRANNDHKVRTKTAAWLNNVDDMITILDHLPEDQLNDSITDDDIFSILKLVERLLRVKRFSPVAVYSEDHWRGLEGEVNDLDIWRAYNVYRHTDNLVRAHLSRRHPFGNFDLLLGMDADLSFRGRLQPDEIKTLSRIRNAIRAYSEKEAARLEDVWLELEAMSRDEMEE